jgi:hypothetical protein
MLVHADNGSSVFKPDSEAGSLPGDALWAKCSVRLFGIDVDEDGERIFECLLHLREVCKRLFGILGCGTPFQLHCNKIPLVSPFRNAPLKRNMNDDIRPNPDLMHRQPFLILLLDNRISGKRTMRDPLAQFLKQSALESPFILKESLLADVFQRLPQ